MIVLLLAGSAFLGWRAMQQQKTIDRYEAAMAPDGEVEQLAQRILKRAHTYSQYKERSAKEGVKGDGADRVNSYIFEIAARRNVIWGNPKIGKPRESRPLTGFTDSVYSITPAEKNASAGRNQIANFFFLLEDESRKLKITNIDLRLATKNVKPHEIPPDLWAVDLSVTMRERSKN